MKICKNNSDICLFNAIYCQECSFDIENECKWICITGIDTPGCGGVKSNNLSDIFTL